jgi:predicted PurR-regulated permease PerM
MKRFIQSTLIVLATLGGVVLLWELRLAVVLFVFSLVVAAVVRPGTDFWVRHGLSRGLAIVLTYILSLAFLAGFFYLISPPLLRGLQQASDNFAVTYEHITQTWPQGTAFQKFVASQLPPPQDLYKAIAGDQGTRLLQNVFGIAQGFALIVGQFFIVLVLSIYWSADRMHFERLWLSLLPAQKRARARFIWRSVEASMGAYVRGELIQSLVAGVLLGLGYYFMGLQYPALLALTGALLWLIPWLGAVLAVILPLISGLTVSVALGVFAGVYTLGVLILLELVVEPRMFDRRRYSSLLTVVTMVILADVYGLFGVLIAPPLAAAIQILFRNLSRTEASEQLTTSVAQITRLRERLEQFEIWVKNQPSPPAPEVTNLVERLEELVCDTEDYLQAKKEPEKTELELPVTREPTAG